MRIAHRLASLLVRGLDFAIRRAYGIRSYTDDPCCVLRVAVGSSDCGLVLSDNVEVSPGDAVLELHLWNERMPRISSSGPDLAWGRELSQRAAESLAVLGEQLAAGRWPELRVVRGEILVAGPSRHRLWSRVMRRYGFDVFDPGPPQGLAARTRRLGEDLLAWALAWTFNPVGARGRGTRFQRLVAWMSRQRLVERYATGLRPGEPVGSNSCTEDLSCSR